MKEKNWLQRLKPLAQMYLAVAVYVVVFAAANIWENVGHAISLIVVFWFGMGFQKYVMPHVNLWWWRRHDGKTYPVKGKIDEA